MAIQEKKVLGEIESSEQNVSLEFQGEPTVSIASGVFTFLIIAGLGVSFILLGNFYSIVTGIALLGLVLFILSKAVRKVSFLSDKIIVRYFLGNEKIVAYSQCKKLYKSNDGLMPAPINVMKYSLKGRERKFTFVCSDEELDGLCDLYFNGFRAKSHHE